MAAESRKHMKYKSGDNKGKDTAKETTTPGETTVWRAVP